MDFAARVCHHPPTASLPRLRRSLWRQARANPRCPATRIDGRVALVTGGSRGVGLETSRGLAARGAEVVSAARGREAGERMIEALRAEHDRPAHFLPLDLADLSTLPRSLDGLESVLAGRRLDVLVANAGVWPRRYARSAQGHEIAFATNVLGHAALVRRALERGLLAEGARVVIVTGDIYVMASGCSADFVYRGALGGQQAYCRSKLGNLWTMQELARREPSLRVHAVHPGVVASGLGGGRSGVGLAIKRALMLSPEQGAQTSLFCATQPGLRTGSYYHNVLGRVEFAPSDPARDEEQAAGLWSLLERLV
ncbi:MAG: SDR family NAD(P)-dependent oxidoreductase [Myxococcota bacterium]